MYKQIDQEIKKIAKNDQTETILGTYKQNTYTLSRGGGGGGGRRVCTCLDPRLVLSKDTFIHNT